MNIIWLKPSEITPYFRNPRNNEDAIIPVAESIKAFGFRNPIHIDENYVIIAGHTRWKAALKLELKKIPVIIHKDLKPNEIQALRIADNKLGEIATWNAPFLKEEFKEIDEEFHKLTGFKADEIAQLLNFEIIENDKLDPNVHNVDYGSAAMVLIIYNIKAYIDRDDLRDFMGALDQKLLDMYQTDQKKYNAFGEKVIELIKKNEDLLLQ